MKFKQLNPFDLSKEIFLGTLVVLAPFWLIRAVALATLLYLVHKQEKSK